MPTNMECDGKISADALGGMRGRIGRPHKLWSPIADADSSVLDRNSKPGVVVQNHTCHNSKSQHIAAHSVSC